MEVHKDQEGPESYFDFPLLPVINLFQRGDREGSCEALDNRLSSEHNLRMEEGAMHNH